MNNFSICLINNYKEEMCLSEGLGFESRNFLTLLKPELQASKENQKEYQNINFQGVMVKSQR